MVLPLHVGRVDKNNGFGTSLWDVFVLQLLTVTETIHFIKMSAAFERFSIAVGRCDNSEATTSNISKSAMETIEISSMREENSKWNFLLVGAIKVFWKEHNSWINSNRECVSIVIVEISFQSPLDHLQHSFKGISGLFTLEPSQG